MTDFPTRLILVAWTLQAVRRMTDNVIEFQSAVKQRRSKHLSVLEQVDELIQTADPMERIALALALATRLSELAARILGDPPGEAKATVEHLPARLLTVDEAATMAGVTRRWIYDHTKGLKFRRELSRKKIRLEEVGFLRWLEFHRP